MRIRPSPDPPQAAVTVSFLTSFQTFVLLQIKRARPLTCEEASLNDWENPVLPQEIAFGSPAVRSDYGPVALRPRLIPRDPRGTES
jgi:hypothetical protein